MNQGNYTEQSMGWPVLDLTNPQSPTYIPAGDQIRSLAPACYRIAVKNTITVTDATIVVCSDTTPTNCTDPGSCPSTVDPFTNPNYNLKATVTASVAQNGVIIEFDYLKNDVPIITPTTAYQKTVNLVAGSNTVYLFTSNQSLAPDDTISLYGARVVSS